MKIFLAYVTIAFAFAAARKAFGADKNYTPGSRTCALSGLENIAASCFAAYFLATLP